MAKSRFEEYVEERIAEMVKPKRDKLEAALQEAEELLEKQNNKYIAMVEDGVKKLIRDIVAQAEKNGCKVSKDTEDVEILLSSYVRERIYKIVGFQKEYVSHGADKWPKGTVARQLQDELQKLDDRCRREARRVVVYKVDLGLKPEKFEAMLAEVAKRLEEA